MALPTIEDVKNYLRIDGNEDDFLIQSLIKIAQEYLSDAGVKDQTTERYKLAVLLLVSGYYEERKPYTIGGYPTNLSFSLESLIIQLKAAELPSEEETT